MVLQIITFSRRYSQNKGLHSTHREEGLHADTLRGVKKLSTETICGVRLLQTKIQRRVKLRADYHSVELNFFWLPNFSVKLGPIC